MKYVIGIDIGTSAVKVLLVNRKGDIVNEVSQSYSIIQSNAGYSEQDPNDWVIQTKVAIKKLIDKSSINKTYIEGISFSGQMHGLVLVNEAGDVLRNAILWNDTRTTEQCKYINEIVGEENLFNETQNIALEGFTLPKLLWVKKYEPKLYSKINKICLPKDYVRFKLTGKLEMEYSDAAGTLLLNVHQKKWSKLICSKLDINPEILPPLIESNEYCGEITKEFARDTGLSIHTKVFAGGADNACGAIGAGILDEGDTLCSIGTSGVILNYSNKMNKLEDNLHYFNHVLKDKYYSMGVTLSAGYSLSWLLNIMRPNGSYEELLSNLNQVPIGANGLIFTPYLVGERTPHADAKIRSSFIGLDSSHTIDDIVRSVIEGITFSLNESVELLKKNGKSINHIISIGGGAKNQHWLQMQADIFDVTIKKLQTEQGPGLGAAMIAAVGCGWFNNMKDCAQHFLKISETYEPIKENVNRYKKVFNIYRKVYDQTKGLNDLLAEYRN